MPTLTEILIVLCIILGMTYLISPNILKSSDKNVIGYITRGNVLELRKARLNAIESGQSITPALKNIQGRVPTFYANGTCSSGEISLNYKSYRSIILVSHTGKIMVNYAKNNFTNGSGDFTNLDSLLSN